MSTRRDFLIKTLGFVGVGVGSALASKVNFDNSKDLGIAKTKDELNKAEAYATCGYGMGCSGGGGQCGFGMGCGGDGGGSGGGGGQCGYGMGCSGGGGRCGYGMGCGGS